MSRLKIVPIVDGHGEQNAIRTLLERIWYELLSGEYIEVLRPIRQKRERLIRNIDDALTKAVKIAFGKLAIPSQSEFSSELVLILVDADKDLPCVLGPDLLNQARPIRPDKNVSCVIANLE